MPGLSLTADQSLFILRAVGLPALEREQPTTQAVIAAIPADKASFRPDPKSRTAFELAWHIVSAEIKYLEATAAGVFPYEMRPVPDAVRTPADIVAWHDERFGPAMARLNKTTGEELLRIVDFYGLRKFPALWLIQIILNHTIHHRGQLSTYLRPMGGRVPSIYGESYDAREAREKATKS